MAGADNNCAHFFPLAFTKGRAFQKAASSFQDTIREK